MGAKENDLNSILKGKWQKKRMKDIKLNIKDERKMAQQYYAK